MTLGSGSIWYYYPAAINPCMCPKFYTAELDLTGLKALSIGIDIDWAMLIACFRKAMKDAEGTAIR